MLGIKRGAGSFDEATVSTGDINGGQPTNYPALPAALIPTTASRASRASRDSRAYLSSNSFASELTLNLDFLDLLLHPPKTDLKHRFRINSLHLLNLHNSLQQMMMSLQLPLNLHSRSLRPSLFTSLILLVLLPLLSLLPMHQLDVFLVHLHSMKVLSEFVVV